MAEAPTRYTLPDAVVAQVVGDEMVLLQLDSGIYFSLNSTASTGWRVIADGGTVFEAADAVVERFAVGREEATSDLIAVLSQAAEQGLLVAE